MERSLRDEKHTREHILICLSSAPSNARIIRTAARMAKAFEGDLTALYVQVSEQENISPENRNRLQNHIRLAEQNGAVISTVVGDDISYQIAEFARLNKVTKVVIGQSNTGRGALGEKKSLTDKLIEMGPSFDIYVIPDTAGDNNRRSAPSARPTFVKEMLQWWIMFLMLALVAGIAFWLKQYPVVLLVLVFVIMIACMLVNRLGEHARQSAAAVFRTRILFETSQLLQKEQDERALLSTTAEQLQKLLNRDIVLYPAEGDSLGGGILFAGEMSVPLLKQPKEEEAALWSYQNRKKAGAATGRYSQAARLYMAVTGKERAYGVVGIPVEERPLQPIENSLVLSILGECALAVENLRNAREKEETAVLAQNEQLRANLLRTISHDLRTPLTSISGNAQSLLAGGEMLAGETGRQMLMDICEDANWLIQLVENLLAITRIGEGRMKLQTSAQLVDEVMGEALNYIHRIKKERTVETKISDELILAQMDTRLICQVLVNLVDNALKYTPQSASITIAAEKEGANVVISVADTGPGIPKEQQRKVFEMFYTGEHRVADSRRSLGLGLALCRSIVEAHGGRLWLEDNEPHGCIFTFTIPVSEVILNE